MQQPRPRQHAVLSAFGVAKRYASGDEEIWALKDCFMEVERGNLACIWGPTGSGKTTLLSLLAGLERPDDGEIYLDGVQIDAAPERAVAEIRRRKVGFFPHANYLLPDLSVLENIALPLLLAGQISSALRKARQTAEQLGLSQRLKCFPSQLTPGEKQIASMARAMINDPVIILADEPTIHVDDQASHSVLELLCSAAGQGYTLVVASRDERIAQAADQVIELG